MEQIHHGFLSTISPVLATTPWRSHAKVLTGRHPSPRNSGGDQGTTAWRTDFDSRQLDIAVDVHTDGRIDLMKEDLLCNHELSVTPKTA